jgi:hypothetical protein
MPRKKEPEAVGDVVRRLMRGRLGKKAKREVALMEVWEEIVGAERAGRLTPLRLRAGVLWVAVESPPLLYEVSQFERPAILRRIQERLPDLGLEDVRFRLG